MAAVGASAKKRTSSPGLKEDDDFDAVLAEDEAMVNEGKEEETPEPPAVGPSRAVLITMFILLVAAAFALNTYGAPNAGSIVLCVVFVFVFGIFAVGIFAKDPEEQAAKKDE